LGPISAENDGRASVAVTITPGLVLPRISYIEDADGPYEIELRSADIDVRAILNELEGPVGWNEIVDWRGLERSTVIGPVQGFKDAASVV
jgi:hypothetical protein